MYITKGIQNKVFHIFNSVYFSTKCQFKCIFLLSNGVGIHFKTNTLLFLTVIIPARFKIHQRQVPK